MATATKKSASSPTEAYPSRRALRYQHRRDQVRHRVIAAVGAGLLVIVVVFVVVLSKGDKATPPPAFVGSTLNLILGDYNIVGDLTAPAGAVRLQAVNQGGIDHNVGIRRGPISGTIKPGGSFTVDLGVLAPGTYELYCDIVDHVEQGMVADLVITPVG